MPRSPSMLQILVAVPSSQSAQRIATHLLASRLCACAQAVGPVTSRFRWRGKIETSREHLLLVKTRTALFGEVVRAVRALHPYQVPEIVALPCTAVYEPYLAWLRAETRAAAPAKSRRRADRKPAAARRAR